MVRGLSVGVVGANKVAQKADVSGVLGFSFACDRMLKIHAYYWFEKIVLSFAPSAAAVWPCDCDITFF